MREKTYSARKEKRFLDALGRGLLKEFPNPERVGCPGSQLLRGIAFRNVPLAEAEPWLEHLTSCSPCYRDFTQFREVYQRRRNRTILAIAASILVAASVAAWALVHQQRENLFAQTAILDLRDRSVSRGTEPNPAEPPLEVNRKARHWNIYLPLGSREDRYDIRLVTPSGELLLATTAVATLKDSITTLQIPVNLASARPGSYVLQVRETSLEWQSYRLQLK